MDYISVKGARQHNLKDIDVKIPKHQLVVFTGLSGSGKSSLAFDTIYAEGQRRYVESLSSYARQFLGIMSKPDVDSIDGLSPTISIDQKTTSHNPRSTVGTITEIYDYFRLLFARVGHPHCSNCNREISRQTSDQIVSQILDLIDQQLVTQPTARIAILSPVVRDRKGEFSGLMDNLRKKGYTTVRVDKVFFDLSEDIVLIKTNKHTISAVVERVSFDRYSAKSASSRAQLKSRLTSAVETALELSDGLVIATQVLDSGFDFPKKPTQTKDHLYSEKYACPHCNISLPEIEPRIFSFNSPHGACPTCNGLGRLLEIDPDKILAQDISLSEGAIVPLSKLLDKDTWYSRLVATVVQAHGGSMKTPFKKLPKKLQELLLNGDDPSFTYTVYGTNRSGYDTSIQEPFTGFISYLQSKYSETDSDFVRHELERFMRRALCPDCQGARLKLESLAITISDQNIAQISDLPINQALSWIQSLTASVFSPAEKEISDLIIKEIVTRLNFLSSVGLNYLSLSREAATLAGGEAQRIRLASQIGTGLTGVLYILDEPTIGLHPRDNSRLISTLKHLRDLGNSVIVVEHDADTILSGDHVIDFGPAAGKHGGLVISQGSPEQIKLDPKSLTGQYLSGKKTVFPQVTPRPTSQPTSRLEGDLTLTGCTIHNLQNIDITIPLGKLTCITGVSGSGKSSLMHDTLYYALLHRLGRSHKKSLAHFRDLQGADQITKVSLIDQSPIGKTPRSNPATYTKTFDLIRKLFANVPDARARGYKPGRFSFNVKGGRCEACQGDGEIKIEMQFLPDIYVTCEVCHGARYNSETLEVAYKGRTISDILHSTIDDSLEIFHNHSALKHKLQTLTDVGLGYLELGQPAPTLSGGEAQRVKLARELAVNSHGHTIYLLDEPTTGLHFEDVNKLLAVLYRLVSQGNTVVLIEHNLDVIKNAQHLIDLGPEGGSQGGYIVATGTPQHIASDLASHTGQFLKPLL